MKFNRVSFRKFAAHVSYFLWVTLAASAANAQNRTLPAARPPVGKTQDGLKRLLVDAESAYRKDDYRSALAKLLDIYVIKPTASILVNFGRTYEEQGDWPSAMACYRRFLEVTEGSTSGNDKRKDSAPPVNETDTNTQIRENIRNKIEQIEISYPFTKSSYPPSYCVHAFVLPEQSDGVQGKSVSIRLVGPPDRSVTPILRFRRKGEEQYSRATFRVNVEAPSEWYATLPGGMAAATYVQYYVEFYDIDENRLTPVLDAVATASAESKAQSETNPQAGDSIRGQPEQPVSPFHSDYEPGQILIVDPSSRSKPSRAEGEEDGLPPVKIWAGADQKTAPLPPVVHVPPPPPPPPPPLPWPFMKTTGATLLALGLASVGTSIGLLVQSMLLVDRLEQAARCDGPKNQNWLDGVAVCPHFGANQLPTYDRALPEPSAGVYENISRYRAAGISILVIGGVVAGIGGTLLALSRNKVMERGRTQPSRSQSEILPKTTWRIEPVVDPRGVGLSSRIEF